MIFPKIQIILKYELFREAVYLRSLEGFITTACQLIFNLYIQRGCILEKLGRVHYFSLSTNIQSIYSERLYTWKLVRVHYFSLSTNIQLIYSERLYTWKLGRVHYFSLSTNIQLIYSERLYTWEAWKGSLLQLVN